MERSRIQKNFTMAATTQSSETAPGVIPGRFSSNCPKISCVRANSRLESPEDVQTERWAEGSVEAPA